MEQKYSLSRKVTIASILFLVLIVASALFSLYNILSVGQAFDYMQNNLVEEVYWNGKYRSGMISLTVEATQALYDLQKDAEDIDEANEEIEESLQQLQHVIASERQFQIVGTAEPHQELYSRRVQVYKSLNTLTNDIKIMGELQHEDTGQVDEEIVEEIEAFENQVSDISFDAQALVQQDIATVHTYIHDHISTGIIGFGITFALLAIGVVVARFIVQRQIVQPIHNVSTAAIAVTQGDLKQSVVVTNNDEIGSLQHAFNQMVESLYESHVHLEKQIENRTLELQHTLQELSERTVQLDEALEVAEDARSVAESASKAKSAFLANMSHELRTPLNAILGFSQILLRSKLLTPDQQEQVELIHNSGDHLLTLINDVLDMSKIEAGKTTFNEVNFDLHRLLADLAGMLNIRAADKKLQLVFDRDSNVPQFVTTDQIKLRQVLINLVNNAIKFTQEGGIRVSITALGNQAGTQQIEFEIVDTGAGMSPDELDTIFEAFSQTSTGRVAQEGTGLGLAISQKFVQLMGGTISVESHVGQGTTFRFTIQVQVVKASQVAEAYSSRYVVGLAAGQPVYRILVVDDKWSNRIMLLKMLASLGFDVREAGSGSEAIEISKEWHPHVVWMDIHMPGMNGFDATKEIKALPNGSDITVIALTASSLEDEQHRASEAGCADFLRKPFRDSEMFDMMERYANIKFVYAGEEKPRTSDKEAIADTPETYLTAENLQQLPSEWIDNLYRAAGMANMRQLGRVIRQVRSLNPQLADELSKLVDEFRFDQIRLAMDASLKPNA